MIASSGFRPASGLSNRHLQTLLPALGVVPTPTPPLRREILATPDGDTLALDWLDNRPADPASPLLLILHGLEGSSRSSYARCLLDAARCEAWRAVVVHFRDCGDHRNQLTRRYHAGETGDVEFVSEQLSRRFPNSPLLAAGFSLGGNVLLKHLGEQRDKGRIRAAVAVSVPFELQQASEAISNGFSKFYQWHLMRNMKKALRRKFRRDNAPFDYDAAMQTTTFETFDDLVTAPLHGFDGKDDYYRRCSSRQFLGQIETPTLILHAIDDPFMNTQMIPAREELADSVTLELSANGGHVGFIDGDRPWRLGYWLPGRIMRFLKAASE